MLSAQCSACQPPLKLQGDGKGLGKEGGTNGAALTIVVSVTEPKLLMKMLHVTLTGGPGKQPDNTKPPYSSW